MITVSVKELDRFFAQYEGFSTPLYKKVRDWWLQLNAISGSVNVDSQTAFVSSDTGDNGTAVVGDLNKPFETITAALAASPIVCVISATYFGNDDITSSCLISSLPNCYYVTVNSIDDSSGAINMIVMVNATVFSVNNTVTLTDASILTFMCPSTAVVIAGTLTLGNNTNLTTFTVNAHDLILYNTVIDKCECRIDCVNLIELNGDFSFAHAEGFSYINANKIRLFTFSLTQKLEFKNNTACENFTINADIENDSSYGIAISNWQKNFTLNGNIKSGTGLLVGVESCLFLETLGAGATKFYFNGNIESETKAIEMIINDPNSYVKLSGSMKTKTLGETITLECFDNTCTVDLTDLDTYNENGLALASIYIWYGATTAKVNLKNVKIITTGAVNSIDTDAAFPNTTDIYVLSCFTNNGFGAQINNLVVGGLIASNATLS